VRPNDAGVYPGIFPPGITPEPERPSDPVALARQLYESMKGLGTDDDKLIQCVAGHTRQERVDAAAAFEQQYKGRLSDWIRGDTSFWYRRTLLRLCMPRDELLAFLVFDATDGVGTKDEALIDVLTQFTVELPRVVAAYSRMYHVSLRDAVIGDTSGNYKKTLLACLNNRRDPPGMIHQELIESDARALYQAGEAVLGTKEEVFIRIFTERSAEHLQAVNQYYPNVSRKKRSLEQAVISETSGNFRDALLSLMEPMVPHFAKRIYFAMKGLGTNDTLLVNSFTALETPILLAVEQHYPKMSKGSKLVDDVTGDTSGNYRKLLLALLRPHV